MGDTAGKVQILPSDGDDPEDSDAEGPRATPVTGAPTRQEALVELNRLKSALLNTAAHELSTPLTPLRLQTNLLKSGRLGPLTESQRSALEVVDRNVDRLQRVVRDLVDVADLEARRMPLEKTPINLALLTSETVAAFTGVAEQAGVTLTLDTAGELPVDGDGRRLTQVLHQFLSNAVKFTPKGGKVTVTTRKEEGVAVVLVRDTGAGLKPEDFPKLFQPFGQVIDPLDATRPGAGLGLVIAQGVIERHGGRIWCDSPGPNQGSTFAFALPLRGAPEADAAVTLHKLAAAPQAAREPVKHSTVWTLVHFKCPACGTRDIHMRILRNRYECNRCGHAWR